MNPCRGRGPGSMGGEPTGWTLLGAADRRWAVIHGWDSPRGSVDSGSERTLEVIQAHEPAVAVDRDCDDVEAQLA